MSNVHYIHTRPRTHATNAMGALLSNGDVNDPSDPVFGAKNPAQLSAYLGLVAASWSLRGAIGGVLVGALGVLAVQYYRSKQR